MTLYCCYSKGMVIGHVKTALLKTGKFGIEKTNRLVLKQGNRAKNAKTKWESNNGRIDGNDSGAR